MTMETCLKKYGLVAFPQITGRHTLAALLNITGAGRLLADCCHWDCRKLCKFYGCFLSNNGRSIQVTVKSGFRPEAVTKL